jgi:hypothetical protein
MEAKRMLDPEIRGRKGEALRHPETVEERQFCLGVRIAPSKRQFMV